MKNREIFKIITSAFLVVQVVPDNKSTTGKSKTTRDTKRINEGLSLLFCVCTKKTLPKIFLPPT